MCDNIKDTLSSTTIVRRVPYTTATFSSVSTIDSVLQHLCQYYRLDTEATRLWHLVCCLVLENKQQRLALQTDNADSPRSGAAEQLLQLDDMSMTLRELNITSGAKIVLDVRVYNTFSSTLIYS